MSKSKGEFLTVSLLEEKGYDPLVYRLFCLNSHYRRSLVFTYENLDNAAAVYKSLVSKISALENSGGIDRVEYERLKKEFANAMDNDLNTAQSLTVLSDVLKSPASGETKLKLISEFDTVLSLGLIPAAQKLKNSGTAEEELPEEVQSLLEQRKAARKAKDFSLADSLRDQISALGYTVEETRQGTKVRKS